MVNIEVLHEIAEEMVDRLNIEEDRRVLYASNLADRMRRASANEKMLGW